MMFDWIEPLTITVFVEALLHTLWVGALCALGLFFVLKQLQVRRVHVRYGAGLLAFSVISLSLPVAVAVLSVPEQASAVTPAGASAVTAAVEPSSSQVESERSIASELASWEALVAESPEAGERVSWEVFVFAFWILGSCLGFIRIVCSLRGAVRLRRGGEPVTHLGMADLCERFGLRRVVPVFSTALSGVPAVCGLFKPVILFPISQLTALAPAQLEAILAHELAHIRRCDHLVNFVQLVVEALLFFNPFLWWVSGQVRQEREAACDALAVEVTGERLSYVQTLADVAAGQLSSGAATAVSFAGHSSGSLLDRVKRLLRPTASSELRLRLPMVCALLLAALCAFVATQWVAHVTVRALTPEERIERVDAVHEIYPQYAVEPHGWDEVKGEESQLSGQLLRPDGTPPQQQVPFYSYVRSGRGSMISSQITDRDGHFKFIVRPGDVSLLFLAEGWAPLYVPLGEVREAKTGMTYQLERGFRAQLRLTDPDGNPVPNARVNYQWDLAPSGRLDSVETNAEGLAELENLGHYPLIISCRVPGYQEFSWKGVKLQPEETHDLVVESSQLVLVRVQDASNGEPIAGAKVEVLARDFSAGKHMNALGVEKPRVTSEAGVASIDTLNDNGRYHFGVSAPGYVGEIIGPLLAGEAASVSLEARPLVPFRIQGVPESLVNDDGQIELTVSYTFTYEDHQASGRDRETLWGDVTNGLLQFDYSPKWRSEIEIQFGEIELSYLPEEFLTAKPLHVSLSPEESGAGSDYTLRPVELRFLTPEGEPAAEGRVLVRFDQRPREEGQSRRLRTQRVVDVIEGVAQLEIPVPNELEISPEGIRGYWFKRVWRVEVPAEPTTKPFVQAIETTRAGAIAGSVYETDGSVASGLLIGVFETKQSVEASKRSSLDIKVKNSSGSHDLQNEFLASPLPLGGSYMISAYRGNTYMLSKPIRLTEERPVQRIRMEIPAGIRLVGQIVNEAGEPVPMAETKFIFEPNDGHRFSRSGPRTDREGRFVLDAINPKVDGAYYLIVDSVPGYQPVQSQLRLNQAAQTIRLKSGHHLRGVVREAGMGKVIPGAEVYAMRAEYEEGAFPAWFDTALTDAQGRFEFTNLPKGAFKIASRSGKMASGYEAVGSTGSDELVEVEIQLYEWTKLVPVDAE